MLLFGSLEVSSVEHALEFLFRQRLTLEARTFTTTIELTITSRKVNALFPLVHHNQSPKRLDKSLRHFNENRQS